jgi:hypothetical protein
MVLLTLGCSLAQATPLQKHASIATPAKDQTSKRCTLQQKQGCILINSWKMLEIQGLQLALIDRPWLMFEKETQTKQSLLGFKFCTSIGVADFCDWRVYLHLKQEMS